MDQITEREIWRGVMIDWTCSCVITAAGTAWLVWLLS